MKWDPKWPRRKKIVLPADVAEAMGMSETDRLDLANGTYFTMDDLIRELEAASGTGGDDQSGSGGPNAEPKE